MNLSVCQQLGGLRICKPANHEELDKLPHCLLVAIVVIQICICVAGTASNLTALIVLIKNRELHTIPNIYIGHMCILDLGVCVFIIPSAVSQGLIRRDISTVNCKLLGYFVMVNLGCQMFTLMLIAVNRYILIMRGKATYTRIYSKKSTIISILLVWCWILLIVVVIPEAGFGSYGFNHKFSLCLMSSYAPQAYLHTSAIVSTLVYLPSLACIGFCYYKIIRQLLVIQNRFKNYKSSLSSGVAKEEQVVAGGSKISSQTDEKLIERCTVEHKETVIDCATLKTPHIKQEQRKPEALHLGLRENSEAHSDIDFQALSVGKSRENSANNRTKQPRVRKEYVAILNMIAIFVMLLVCWLPVIILYTIDIHGRQPAWLYKVLVTLTHVNSGFDILLYSLINRSFRKGYAKVFNSANCKCCNKGEKL